MAGLVLRRFSVLRVLFGPSTRSGGAVPCSCLRAKSVAPCHKKLPRVGAKQCVPQRSCLAQGAC